MCYKKIILEIIYLITLSSEINYLKVDTEKWKLCVIYCINVNLTAFHVAIQKHIYFLCNIQ